MMEKLWAEYEEHAKNNSKFIGIHDSISDSAFIYGVKQAYR